MRKKYYLIVGCFSGFLTLWSCDSHLPVGLVYENVTDGVFIGRNIDETTDILKNTEAAFVFRAFWKWMPVVNSPDNIPMELLQLAPEGTTLEHTSERVRSSGHYYEELERWISGIKEKMPRLFFIGSIPAQTLARIEYDPVTERVYSMEETWAMALDPQKWRITWDGRPLTKRQFQAWFYTIHPYGRDRGEYDPEDVPAYFPDMTNSDFQDLMFDWARRQIDCGADGIWIDMLYRQARLLAQITGDMDHPAVRDSADASSQIVARIHRYGVSIGKRIYVGSWPTPFVVLRTKEPVAGEFPYPAPDLDFVTVSPTIREVQNMRLNLVKWRRISSEIKKEFEDIPIFAFIDWSFDESPMVSFSQELTKEEQSQSLMILDESFSNVGIDLIYPLHGGFMGRGEVTTKLAWGIYSTYDALAPEFETYETIKELAHRR